MPMDRSRYPADWEEIALEVKAAAGWRCAACGKQCRKPGQKLDTHRRTLTVHHIDMDPGNCSRENLVALCAPCHLRAHRMARKKRNGGKDGGENGDA